MNAASELLAIYEAHCLQICIVGHIQCTYVQSAVPIAALKMEIFWDQTIVNGKRSWLDHLRAVLYT